MKRNWGWWWRRTYMSKHLILILQSGKSLFKLRVLFLQIFNSYFQVTQVRLLPFPCLLRWNSVPQQSIFIYFIRTTNNTISPNCHWPHKKVQKEQEEPKIKLNCLPFKPFALLLSWASSSFPLPFPCNLDPVRTGHRTGVSAGRRRSARFTADLRDSPDLLVALHR